jgi:thiamine pyrophosphate-dependent acetolactate synthase large subunit-like protein
MVGGLGIKVTRPDDIRPALERALGSGKVSVVNVMTDPKGGRRGSMYLG